MKIKNLKINGFGKLENKKIEFSDGINVIVGNNEAGKSTLLKFITSMFYGVSKNKNGKEIPDFERYKPWNTDDYSGRISYKLDNGEEYEVYREFKKKLPIIYNENKDDITKRYQIDKNKESLFFIEQTGISEENFFSTSVSEQENVKLSNNMKNAVIQRLSNLLSTGNENTSYKKAIDKLNKNQLEEIGSQRSVGRPINQVEEEIEKLENEKKAIEQYQSKKYQVEEQKQNLKIDLEDNNASIDLLRRQKTNLEKVQLEEEKNKILKNVLEENLQNQKRLEEKIENICKERRENLKPNKIGYILSTLAIIIIGIISVLTKKYIALSLNLIPIILITILGITNNKKKNKIRQNGKRLYGQKVLLEEEIDRLKKEYNQKEAEIRNKEQEILNNQKLAEREIISDFIGKIDRETIEDILSTKYERIVEFIDEKERENAEFKASEKRIEIDNENIISKLEDLVKIDEKLEKFYEKKDELLELNNIYEIVKKEIENSYQEIKENITPEFIEELNNIISEVTNGKYQNIYLDSENNLLVETEKGNYVPIEMLSTGTIDLIYLALRLSATKEISKENLPIILDESFAYYDKERMTKILKYLSSLKQYQVLILTCSEREIQTLKQEGISYNIIELWIIKSSKTNNKYWLRGKTLKYYKYRKKIQKN